MANFDARVNVCWGFHDVVGEVMHTANMIRERKPRWFLKQWRNFRGYTQERLAEMTNLSKPYISQLERGDRQYTQDLLEAFAIALQCAPVDLIIRDPTDPEGIWSVWDTLQPTQRSQVVEIAKTLKRTGTDG